MVWTHVKFQIGSVVGANLSVIRYGSPGNTTKDYKQFSEWYLKSFSGMYYVDYYSFFSMSYDRVTCNLCSDLIG